MGSARRHGTQTLCKAGFEVGETAAEAYGLYLIAAPGWAGKPRCGEQFLEIAKVNANVKGTTNGAFAAPAQVLVTFP